MAKEVADTEIRIHSVAPAVIHTPILDQVEQETIDYMVSKIPVGRTGTTEEVAALVHYLSSEDASFTTGACFDVSGGRATVGASAAPSMAVPRADAPSEPTDSCAAKRS